MQTAELKIRKSVALLTSDPSDTSKLGCAHMTLLLLLLLLLRTTQISQHTVMSKPQLLAVLSRMEDAAAEYGLIKQNSAGSSQWEVLDFGSIVCHVFTAEQREYYGLDDFYARAEEVELPFVTTPAAADEGYGQQYGEDVGSTIGGLWTKSI
jgi:hypothetical protein